MPIASQLNKNRTERTTVLHLSPNIESSDPGRETVDIAILTQRSGWRSVIASSGGRLVNEAERAAVRHIRMPLDRSTAFFGWRNRLHLEAILKSEKPALIHAHGIETIQYAVSLSRSHGIPLIADLTQPLENLPRTDKLLKQVKTTRAMLRVPSEFMGKHLHERFGVERDRLCLVPPGIDLQMFNVGFISPERLHKISNQWRLPEQASIILVPNPLEDGMGHATFLEALKSMKDENIYAVLLGSHANASSGIRNEIEGLIQSYGLGGKVILPEDCPDLSAACWLSSVVVAPNLLPRGQNLELLAAQAIGRPVIISDVGANPEMAKNGETALAFKPGDVDELTCALREALSLSTDQRLALAKTTHLFVAEKFPQYKWFEGIMELYESLLYPSRQTARANVA